MLRFVLFLALLSCAPPPLNDCECLICEQPAILLTVVDSEDGGAIDDFVVEARRNDEEGSEPPACRPAERTTNVCGIGDSVGIYQITITSPSHARVEKVVRVAGEGGGVCCNACLRTLEVTAHMDAL